MNSSPLVDIASAIIIERKKGTKVKLELYYFKRGICLARECSEFLSEIGNSDVTNTIGTYVK